MTLSSIQPARSHLQEQIEFPLVPSGSAAFVDGPRGLGRIRTRTDSAISEG
jgi:hypothetical protein